MNAWMWGGVGLAGIVGMLAIKKMASGGGQTEGGETIFLSSAAPVPYSSGNATAIESTASSESTTDSNSNALLEKITNTQAETEKFNTTAGILKALVPKGVSAGYSIGVNYDAGGHVSSVDYKKIQPPAKK